MGNVLIDRGSDRETETKRGKAKGLTIRSSKTRSGEKRKGNVESLASQIANGVKKKPNNGDRLTGPTTLTFCLF